MRKHAMIALALSGSATRAMIGPMSAAERRMGRYMRGPEDHPEQTPEKIAEGLKKSIDERTEAIKKVADDALAEAKKTGDLTAETKGVADKALLELNTLREQLSQIEQKMARRPGADENDVKSFGAQVTESDRYKAFIDDGARGSFKVSLEMPARVKAITVGQTGTAWSERDPDMTSLPRRGMVVRDLLDVVPTSSASIDYARQTTRTNNAGVVAEGNTKPTSNYIWEQINAPVRTIAHLAKLTRQAIDDSVQLQGEVESEMRYGLALAEEGELLSGDGTGQHLTGMIPNATAYAAPIIIADLNKIDVIRLALLQAELALYPSDGVVMNNADWAEIELTKTAQGAYVFANPMQLAGPRLWGKPVVPTIAMSVKKFLAGGFKLQRLYDRMAPEVVIASENSDDFEKNLYTMRCENRLALAIKRPGALIYGDFDAALAA